MPILNARGPNLCYHEHGIGPETIVLLHDLGFSSAMFEMLVSTLAATYRCISIDFRGHGGSEQTFGGYDLDTLYRDTLATLETLGVLPCHVLGSGLGAQVATRLASRKPRLVRSVILLGSAANAADLSSRQLRGAALFLGVCGSRALAGLWMRRSFSYSFRRDTDHKAERDAWQRRLASNRRRGWSRALRGMARSQGVVNDLGKVTAPVLVIHGSDDLTPALSDTGPRRSRHQLCTVTLSGRGTVSTIEQPGAVAAAILAFLADTAAPPAQ